MYRTYTGGEGPPDKCNTKYTSPLRVFDDFNSKAKTIATFDFAIIRTAKLKVARFLPRQRTASCSGVVLRSSGVTQRIES